MIQAAISEAHHSPVYHQTPPLSVGFNPLDLLQIFEQDLQITVVDRDCDKHLVHYLQGVGTSLGRGFQCTLQAHQSVAEKVLAQRLLPDQPGRDALLTDLDLLAQLYLDLIGCPHIGLRLEVLHGAMCPRFHVDRTGVRLLCTYMGPGTEWLDDRYADRSKLGGHSFAIEAAQSGLIVDTKGIHQVAPFAIALLKGSLWQGNQSRGVIHRSPAVAPKQTRVIVAIDALW